MNRPKVFLNVGLSIVLVFSGTPVFAWAPDAQRASLQARQFTQTAQKLLEAIHTTSEAVGLRLVLEQKKLALDAAMKTATQVDRGLQSELDKISLQLNNSPSLAELEVRLEKANLAWDSYLSLLGGAQKSAAERLELLALVNKNKESISDLVLLQTEVKSLTYDLRHFSDQQLDSIAREKIVATVGGLLLVSAIVYLSVSRYRHRGLNIGPASPGASLRSLYFGTSLLYGFVVGPFLMAMVPYGYLQRSTKRRAFERSIQEAQQALSKIQKQLLEDEERLINLLELNKLETQLLQQH